MLNNYGTIIQTNSAKRDSCMSKHSRLKEARRELKLTQQEVADKLSVAVSTYRHWEKDTEPNSVLMVERLCDVVQISISWYIAGKHMDTLTKEEKILLDWFRRLNKEKQKAALKLLEK